MVRRKFRHDIHLLKDIIWEIITISGEKLFSQIRTGCNNMSQGKNIFKIVS